MLKLLHTHSLTLGHLSVNAISIQLAVSCVFVILFYRLCYKKSIGTYRDGKQYITACKGLKVVILSMCNFFPAAVAVDVT
jgi:hypothetical protein